MRKIKIYEPGSRDASLIDQNLADDFHATMRTADIVDYNLRANTLVRSTVEKLLITNRELLFVAPPGDSGIRDIGPVAEKMAIVIDKVVDAFLATIRSDLDASGVRNGQKDDLKNTVLNKSGVLDRVVLDFAYSQHRFGRQDAPAEYELFSHRILLNTEQIINSKGEFNLKEFVEVFIHELIHFFSNNEIILPSSAKNSTPEITESVPLATGFQRASENGREIIFVGFNEAVVQMFTIELFGKISAILKDEYPDLSDINDVSSAYNTEISVIRFVIECLAKHRGVSEKMVWQSLKRGLLQGDVLLDPEINEGLVACFGEDVLINFFRKMDENNLFFRYKGPQPTTTSVFDLNEHRRKSLRAALEKRWKYNGESTVK